MKSLELNKPHMIVVIGLPGSGKSFFARQFSAMFSTPFVDYAHYHQIAGNQDLGDVVATELLSQLFLTKKSILIEGRGETKEDRAILARLAHAKSYAILYVWVQTEPVTTKKRATAVKGAPYTEDEFNARVAEFSAPAKTDPQVVISGKHTFVSQARMVLRKLAAPRPVSIVPPARAPRKQSGRINIG